MTHLVKTVQTCDIGESSLANIEEIVFKKIKIPLKNLTDEEIQIITQKKESFEPRRSARNPIKTKPLAETMPIPSSKKQLKPITPLQTANILWKKLVDNKIDVRIGMIVLAKMTTFWPWPAQILNFNKKKARVKFFGDLREGSVDRSACIPFYSCDSVIFNYLISIPESKRNEFKNSLFESLDEPSRKVAIQCMPIQKLFIQAIRDVEIVLNVPESMLKF